MKKYRVHAVAEVVCQPNIVYSLWPMTSLGFYKRLTLPQILQEAISFMEKGKLKISWRELIYILYKLDRNLWFNLVQEQHKKINHRNRYLRGSWFISFEDLQKDLVQRYFNFYKIKEPIIFQDARGDDPLN